MRRPTTLRVSEIGRRDQISLATGWLVNIDWPRFPWSTWSAQAAVLAEKALVQMVTSLEGVDRGGVGGVAADQRCHRPARHQLSQKENHDGKHEQQRDEHEHSP